MNRKLAQRIEQGMGRAIRGSSDWCIVVIVGNKITDFLLERSKRSFLSNEAQLQIRIAEDMINAMKAEGGTLVNIEYLINQCLARDDGWRGYYKQHMSRLLPDEQRVDRLRLAASERDAELFYCQGQYRKASDTLQSIINTVDPTDRSWVMQLMATYTYPIDSSDSMDKQLKAYIGNAGLFRPEKGIAYSKMTSSGTRASRILAWLKDYGSYNAAIIGLSNITDNVSWESSSSMFEGGIDEVGKALGFTTDRPEKRSGKGPDNLWIQGKTYLLIECKNEVNKDREKISKSEIGQLSNSIAWFKSVYEGESCIPILIHRAKQLADDAFSGEAFWVMTPDGLERLKECAQRFYTSLTGTPFESLSSEIITEALKEHALDTNDMVKQYLQRG